MVSDDDDEDPANEDNTDRALIFMEHVSQWFAQGHMASPDAVFRFQRRFHKAVFKNLPKAHQTKQNRRLPRLFPDVASAPTSTTAKEVSRQCAELAMKVVLPASSAATVTRLARTTRYPAWLRRAFALGRSDALVKAAAGGAGAPSPADVLEVGVDAAIDAARGRKAAAAAAAAKAAAKAGAGAAGVKTSGNGAAAGAAGNTPQWKARNWSNMSAADRSKLTELAKAAGLPGFQKG